MKVSSFIILLAVALTGCGQRDPIDRVVRQASSDPFFRNGMWKPILLPATASPEQLASAVFKQDFSELGNVTKILETKKVQIAYKDMTNEVPNATYTAVLVDADIGRKVILFQYSENKRDKRISGWWHRVYDQK